MAAPTSNNEVTARRLSRLLVGADGNGGLWKKIKDGLGTKQSLSDCTTFCGATAGWFKVASTDFDLGGANNINAVFEVITRSNSHITYGKLYINVRTNSAGNLPGCTDFKYVEESADTYMDSFNLKLKTTGLGANISVELWVNPGTYRAANFSLNKNEDDIHSHKYPWQFFSGEATGSAPVEDESSSIRVFSVNKHRTRSTDWITAGTLPVERGGTGKTTALAANNALLSGMAAATTGAEDASLFVFKYVTPADNIGALYSRTGSQVWTYFKGKLTSDTGVNISGNAATATTATNYNTSSGTIKTALDGKASTSHTHSSIATPGDQRNVATSPADYSNKLRFSGLKKNEVIGNPSSDLYSYVVGLRGWDDASGGLGHELAFNNTGIFARKQMANSSTSWGSWSQLVTADSGYARSIAQDVSKGANLVVNGTGSMCSNYNWPDFEWVGNYSYNASAGAFRRNYNANDNAFRTCSEFISVDPSKIIDMSVDVNILSELVACTIRMSIAFYDIDKKLIEAPHIMYGANTCTELAQDLNPGDTVVHLASVANWTTDISQDYKRGFIFWDYTNSYGYTYPPETYSRNYYGNYFDSASSVNTTNNTITLNKAWAGSKKVAGTKVSKCDSGSTYNYISNRTIATTEVNTWFNLHGSLTGMATTGNNPTYRFRQGTAFVKVGFVNSTSNANYTYLFTNFRVYELPMSAPKITTSAKIGDTNKPVYVAADGTITPISSALGAAAFVDKYAGSASAGGPATTLAGTYSGSGGQLAPSAIKKGTVRAVMMNGPKGLTAFPGYCDCILMDTYTGNDVNNVTGMGILRDNVDPRMFIFNGTRGNTTTWNNQAEVYTNKNLLSRAASSGGTTVSLCTNGEKATWNAKQDALTVMTDTEVSDLLGAMA